MTKKFVTSLGEVVIQNHMKAIIAFATLIKPSDPNSMIKVIGGILQSQDTQNALNAFKKGEKSEETFTFEMISTIEKITQITLTPEQFDKAWNAMNPTFIDFSAGLKEIIAEHRPDQQIVFVSYTNPKDMKHFVSQLEGSDIPFTKDDKTGDINSVGGIPLYTTYTANKSKADLIAMQMTGTSASNVLFFGQKSPREAMNVKYIVGIHGNHEPLIAALDQQNLAEIKEATESAMIETLFWDKKAKQPFHDVVRSGTAHLVPAARL